MIPNFSYVRALSLEEAIKHLSSEGARLHAGGVDLLGCLHDRVFGIEKMVSISGLKELHGISDGGNGGLRIGALTTLADVAGSQVIKKRYPALAQAAASAASPQLRHQGTIGGNLCQKPRCWYYRGEFHCLRKGGDRCYAVAGENHYHCILGGDRCYIVHPSDTSPALVALGATVRIAGPEGTRTVAVEKFHVPPGVDIHKETVLEAGEILTEIILPPPAQGLKSSYRKVKARRSWDFALAGVALAIQFEGTTVSKANVVFSGAAPVPWRSKEAEKVIMGQELTSGIVAQAAEAAVGNARPLEHNGYKVSLFRGIVREELAAIARV
jgi:xanthine dehydrogenase YagS FAD-binding subunit